MSSQKGTSKNFPIRPPVAQSGSNNKKVVNDAKNSKEEKKSTTSTPKRHFSVSDCQGYWYIYAPHWEVRTSNLIRCLDTTFVKRTTQYSWELPEHEKREVHKGLRL